MNAASYQILDLVILPGFEQPAKSNNSEAHAWAILEGFNRSIGSDDPDHTFKVAFQAKHIMEARNVPSEIRRYEKLCRDFDKSLR